MKLAAGVAAVILAIFIGDAAARDRITLKSGGSIEGDILKERNNAILVDLGFSILEVPRDDVIEILKDIDKADRPSEEIREDGGKLYSTADLTELGVDECVRKFGEGVVMVSTPSGLGSGFVVSEQGHVVTNAHVIERETKVSVTLFLKGQGGLDRKKIDKVRILAVNPYFDLALLKIEDLGGLRLTKLFLGSYDKVGAGQPVFAVGNPLGLERSVSEGIISNRARLMEGILTLQTTAPINPGNSGGPLLNLRGEVIGVTHRKAGMMAEGLGFAVPVNYLRHFLDNHEAFAYNVDNPNTGYHYLEPPSRRAVKDDVGESGR
ncbi:MAG TPA: trypsin-like peptidase domain-containing protein [Candidatus Brocadiia bacterium]|nr:trypsin-like peptidase domain-containing protein [Candidatus Brocadiia bacterium]